MRIGQWYGYEVGAETVCKVGRVKEVFVCTFGSSERQQCFVYIDSWPGGTKKANLSDFTIDLESRKVTQAIPLKCLSSALHLVSHWDPACYPIKSCLLFVKVL